MATSQQQQQQQEQVYEARGGGYRDDGLWRRLLTRAQQGTSNHNFFLVNVVEGCVHTNLFCKLGLPTVFMHHHYKSLGEHVILEGPDGKRWPTMLGLQLDSQPCLMHGWKEFAASYNLELKDQIVFLLLESSHFLVQVYDANDRVKRRRAIPPPPQNIQYARTEDVRAAAVNQDFRLFNQPQKMKYARSEDWRAGNQPPNMSSARSEDWRAGNQLPNMSCARSEDLRTGKQPQNMSCARSENLRTGKQPQNMSYVRSEDMRAPQNMSYARSEDLRAVNQSQKTGYARSEDRNAVNQVNTPARQSISLSVHDYDPKATRPTQTHGEVSPRRYIQIPDSSEEENEDENQARPPSVSFPVLSNKQDASDGTKVGGSDNKMTLRSAAKAAADLVVPTKDDAVLNPPSSPESMVVLKRSRRLQRKSGDYEGDDLGRATTNILRRKLYKLSSAVSPTGETESAVLPSKEPATPPPKEPATPPPQEPAVPPKEPAVSPKEPAVSPEEPVAPSRKEPVTACTIKASVYSESSAIKLVNSCCSTQQSSMKHRELHQRTTSISLSPSENEKRRPVEEASKRAVAAHNLFYISKRRPVTAQERHKALEAAQAYAQSLPTNKHYVLPLSVAIYCGYHLRVRPEFVEALQLPLSTMWLKLCDSSGKMWEIEWKGDHPRQHVSSQGWTKFVVEHYLEEGDVCVFQKCAPNFPKIILSVEIFRIVPLLEPPEDGWRSHYIIPDRQLLPTESQC